MRGEDLGRVGARDGVGEARRAIDQVVAQHGATARGSRASNARTARTNSLVRASLPVHTTRDATASGKSTRSASASLPGLEPEAHEAAERGGRHVGAAALGRDRLVAGQRQLERALLDGGVARSWPCVASSAPATAADAAADEPSPSLRPGLAQVARVDGERAPSTLPSALLGQLARLGALRGGERGARLSSTPARVYAHVDRGDHRHGALEHGVLARDHQLAGRARRDQPRARAHETISSAGPGCAVSVRSTIGRRAQRGGDALGVARVAERLDVRAGVHGGVDLDALLAQLLARWRAPPAWRAAGR